MAWRHVVIDARLRRAPVLKVQAPDKRQAAYALAVVAAGVRVQAREGGK